MIQEFQEKANIGPTTTMEELFDFETFRKKEEEERAERERSDEEEVSDVEMPRNFWSEGFEQDHIYETGENVDLEPERPDWWKRKVEKILRLHQNIIIDREMEKEQIMAWMYDALKGFFAVKRRGGIIQYFKGAHDLQSLPIWDIRELAKHEQINYTHDSTGTNLQNLIRRECERGFEVFKPQKPVRSISKKTIDPETKVGRVRLVVKPAKTVNRVAIPVEMPVMMRDLDKWFYDSNTGEAVS